MMQRHVRTLALLLATFSGGVGVAAPKRALKPPSDAEIRKMEVAMPAKPRAKPARPRKLLVFNKCMGHRHGSIPHGAKALEIMGRKTGAFEAVVSEDIAMFEPQNLQQFDAVCMNNTTMRSPMTKDLDQLSDAEKKEMDARLKRSLLDFVRSGKGIIGIHAATDCFYKWPEYGEMMGGYFWGHPWHEDVAIKLDDPLHPLCALFSGRDFRITDEIYQFRLEPYSRNNLRVLLSINTTKTNMEKGEKIRRKDGDFAVSWVRSYGKGRVFYCSLGHRNEIFWNPTILQYYLDGIQFALGDLPADTKPTAELSKEYVERSRQAAHRMAFEGSFKEAAKFELGGSSAALKFIAERVLLSHKSPPERKALEEGLIALLESDATADCKRFVCRQLRLMGSHAAVPALAKLLTDEELSDMARYALEPMPGQAPSAALRSALGRAKGKLKVGVINSLGERRDRRSVAALAKLLGGADTSVVRAAALALGKIGGDGAAKALTDARPKARPELRAALADGLLACAEQLETSQRRKAVAIYEAMFSPDESKAIRVVAFKGLARMRGQQAVPLVVNALAGSDPDLRGAAVDSVRTVPGKTATNAFAKQLPRMAVDAQTMLLYALADRSDPLALPAVVKATESNDEPVRVAALRALGSLGDASVAELLARSAAKARARSAEQNASRTSLDRLRGADINDALVACLPKAEAPVRVEIVRRLAARKAVDSVPTLLALARQDKEKSVRMESFKALRDLGREKHLSSLVGLLAKAQSAGERTEAEKVIAAAAKRIDDESKRCDAVLAALKKRPEPPLRCSLLRTLGRIGAPQGLDTVRSALKHSDKDVRDAAIRTLADWPNADPTDTLTQIAASSSNLVHRVLALRGYARLIALPSERPTPETLALYERGLELASRDDERKLLLAGLGGVSHPRALKLAESYFDNEALQDEALMAAAKIFNSVSRPKAVTASHRNEDAGNAIDGNIKTRWSTGKPMREGSWYMLDLGWEQEIRQITLDAGTSRNDYPRSHEVYVSRDKEDWGAPVAKGPGKKTVVDVELKPKTGRFIKIVQTGRARRNFWSIHDLRINGRSLAAAEGKEIADRSGWKMSASVAGNDAKNAIDGNMQTRWGTRGGQKEGQWLMVDLGAERKIRKVVFDAAKSRGDYPRGYKVYVSKDGKDWGPPAAGGVGKRALTSVPLYPRSGRYVKIVQTGSTDRMWWSVYDLKVFAE